MATADPSLPAISVMTAGLTWSSARLEAARCCSSRTSSLKAHYLTVSLRGTTSNRLGIGARLTCHRRLDCELTRELYPQNSFRSQMPSRLHFGLGDAATVDRLTIRWPSGTVQELKQLAVDRHIVVEEGSEGSEATEVVIPGRLIKP